MLRSLLPKLTWIRPVEINFALRSLDIIRMAIHTGATVTGPVVGM